LAALPRIRNHLPIEVERPTLGKSDDLNHNVASSKNEEIGQHRNLLPRKAADQMSVKVKKHQFLEPEASFACKLWARILPDANSYYEL
jgi:hypothetical protein